MLLEYDLPNCWGHAKNIMHGELTTHYVNYDKWITPFLFMYTNFGPTRLVWAFTLFLAQKLSTN